MEKRKGTDDPANELGREILDCIRRMVHELRVASRATEARMGLSGAQLFVLQKLGDGKPISLNELARRTLTHQSSVSVVVGRLVERGCVRRVRSRADGRRLDLSITPSGRKIARNAPGAAQDRLIEAIGRMAEKDRTRLAALLGGLVKGMGIDRRETTMLFEEDHQK
jgi:DNA-binding MarR family transcriptional regulator